MKLPKWGGKKKIWITGLVLVLLAAGLYFLYVQRNDVQDNIEEQAEVFQSVLTGKEISKSDSELPVLGVMIENSVFARPQSGLDSAGIVFEAVTEGGITRYLALYQEDKPETVGPIRSVRTHFLDWAMGFDASIAHVGGSEEALGLIEQRDAKSLSQFNYPDAYYRDQNREAPHNMYAKSGDLVSLQQQLGHQQPEYADYRRGDGASAVEPEVTKITVDYSGPEFVGEFRYDPSSNSYVRFLGGEPHIDALSDSQIRVDNVLVLKAESVPNGVQALGSGDALLFKNGIVEKITWQQKSYLDKMSFSDASGGQPSFNRGQTWIMAVGKQVPVVYN